MDMLRLYPYNLTVVVKLELMDVDNFPIISGKFEKGNFQVFGQALMEFTFQKMKWRGVGGIV